jgi:hypothetical protein
VSSLVRLLVHEAQEATAMITHRAPQRQLLVRLAIRAACRR